MQVSRLVLVAANAVPLAGALFFGWELGSVLALYWFETAVIGAFTVLKILAAATAIPRPLPLPARIGMAAFFCVHFGIFQLVHGVFLVFLLAAGVVRNGGFDLLAAPGRLLDELASTSSLVAVAGLGLSHGVSFVLNFLLGGERQRVPVQVILFSPYRRVLAMHLTLLLGAFVFLAIGSNAVLLAVLVVAKTVADLQAHTAEHRLAASGDQPA